LKFDSCPCLLDFYVLSDLQRHGIGKNLFDRYLQVSTLCVVTALHMHIYSYISTCVVTIDGAINPSEDSL
jgi:hypothetical protein